MRDKAHTNLKQSPNKRVGGNVPFAHYKTWIIKNSNFFNKEFLPEPRKGAEADRNS